MNDSTLTANRREIKEKIITLAKSVMQQKTIFIMSIITFVLSCIFICTKRKFFIHSTCGLMFAMIGWYRSGFKSSTAEMAGAAVRMLSKPLFPDLDKFGFG
jgi:hypothetical protein